MDPTNSKQTITIPGVRLEKLIGQGGMGKVYRGTQTYLGRTVAVKIIFPDSKNHSENQDKRFQREAKLLAGLSQPNIVACYDGGLTKDGHYYLVMEFIDGPDLGRYTRQHGALGERTSLKILHDIAQALDNAFQNGIIHRDVKVENILLKHDAISASIPGFPFQVKLADLGLARYQEQNDSNEQLTKQGVIFGTPHIMAPEQFNEKAVIDYRVDIYALGCLLYQCLHGRPPFESGNFSVMVAKKVMGELPLIEPEKFKFHPETHELIKHLMAFEPENRPSSYTLIVERCNQLLELVPSEPQPMQPMQRRNNSTSLIHQEYTQTLAESRNSLLSGSSSHKSSAKSRRGVWLVSGFVFIAFVSFFLMKRETQPAPLQSISVDTQKPNSSETTLKPGPFLVFSDQARPLFAENFYQRTDSWTKETGSWGADEDGPGVIAVGGEEHALLTHSVAPRGRWEGTVHFKTANDVAAGLTLSDGRTLLARIQDLGEQRLCSLASLEREAQPLQLVPMEGVPVILPNTNHSDGIMFLFERNGDSLVFKVNGQAISTLETRTDAIALVLFTETGVAGFEGVLAYEDIIENSPGVRKQIPDRPVATQ